MKRRIDWPERLAQFIDSRRNAAFAWGRNDCCLFAADGVRFITTEDVDLAQGWRGYKSELGARRRIAKVGGMRGFAAHHGLAECAWTLSTRGNVVLALCEGRETFGLDAGNGYWCAPGQKGLLFRPMSEVIVAYRI